MISKPITSAEINLTGPRSDNELSDRDFGPLAMWVNLIDGEFSIQIPLGLISNLWPIAVQIGVQEAHCRWSPLVFLLSPKLVEWHLRLEKKSKPIKARKKLRPNLKSMGQSLPNEDHLTNNKNYHTRGPWSIIVFKDCRPTAGTKF